jgi:hypothetical protein
MACDVKKFIICANTLPSVASQFEIPCVRSMNFLISESVGRRQDDARLFSGFELSDGAVASERRIGGESFLRRSVVRIELTALAYQRM